MVPDLSDRGGCRRPRATAIAVQLAAPQPAHKFYFKCSDLKCLTGLINVPKFGAEPPNLLDKGQAAELPRGPTTGAAAKDDDLRAGGDAQGVRGQAARARGAGEGHGGAATAAGAPIADGDGDR